MVSLRYKTNPTRHQKKKEKNKQQQKKPNGFTNPISRKHVSLFLSHLKYFTLTGKEHQRLLYEVYLNICGSEKATATHLKIKLHPAGLVI